VSRRDGLTDHLTTLLRITAVATERLHEHGHARLVRHHEFPHHLVKVWSMIAAVAPGDVHDLCVRGLIAGVVPIDLHTGAIERGQARCTSSALGSGSGHAAVERRDARRIEGISGPTEGVVVERRGGYAG
jgi:hypothetical protein